MVSIRPVSNLGASITRDNNAGGGFINPSIVANLKALDVVPLQRILEPRVKALRAL